MAGAAKMTKLVLGPTFETQRLILRPFAREDFDAYASWCADSKNMEFLGGVQPRAMAWRTFATTVGWWALQGFAMFSVIEKSSGTWIGRAGPIHPEGWPGTEVGWGLIHRAWGKGYAIEAATASIDWAFNELGWTDVIHCIDPKNSNSRRVAEKLGSRKLRMTMMPAPYEGIETEVWGQSAEEWGHKKL